jgi:predicted kinase
MSVILTIGIPASGKSTWARQHAKETGAIIVCRDDIRDTYGLASGENETFVTEVHRTQMEAAFLAGRDVIVADTNINPKFRKALIKFCHEHAQDVHLKVFPIDVDDAIVRDNHRTDRVGADIIMKFWNDMQSQSLRDDSYPYPRFKRYDHATGAKWKPTAFVFDIDGTVAEKGDRNPFDESKVSQDKAIWDVVDTAITLHSAGDRIVFVSGRTDGCEEDTREWIENIFQFETWDYDLFMRKSGDVRPDYVVKAEIYDEKVIPNWNIKMVFDDRDQVVRHVRARGITVAQVAQGRF